MNAATVPSSSEQPVVVRATCLRLAVILGRAHHCLASSTRSFNAQQQQQLLDRSLTPGMFSLAQQIICLSDSLTGAAALLHGATATEEPSVQWVFNRGDAASLGAPDTSFAGAHQRLSAAMNKVLAHAGATQAERALTKEDNVVVARPGHRRRFRAPAFVEDYVLPNAYFHLTLIYALLRASGAPIGKADFEGPAAYVVE